MTAADVTPTDPRFCPLCAHWSDSFRADGAGNPNRACPRCGSLERHRFLALLLPTLVAQGYVGVTLDVAPTGPLSRLFDRLAPLWIGVDLDPAADGRTVSCQASLTHLPLADSTVGLVLCSHVLEHVPDDRAAMREITRVLSPSGLGVIAVPQRRGRPTDEDPSAPAGERVLRFGQADHVRYYGDDVGDRLIEAGLGYATITPEQLLPAAVVRSCAFAPSETFWLVRPADGRGEGVTDLGPSLLTQLMSAMAAADARGAADYHELAAAAQLGDERLKRATASARRARQQYDRLATRLPVRVAVQAGSLVKRARALRS